MRSRRRVYNLLWPCSWPSWPRKQPLFSHQGRRVPGPMEPHLNLTLTMLCPHNTHTTQQCCRPLYVWGRCPPRPPTWLCSPICPCSPCETRHVLCPIRDYFWRFSHFKSLTKAMDSLSRNNTWTYGIYIQTLLNSLHRFIQTRNLQRKLHVLLMPFLFDRIQNLFKRHFKDYVSILFMHVFQMMCCVSLELFNNAKVGFKVEA